MPVDRQVRIAVALAALACGAGVLPWGGVARFAGAAGADAPAQPAQPIDPEAGSDAGAAARPAAVDYAALIADLDADDPVIRRRASLRLNSAGGDALPFVDRALADRECGPEGMARLRKALPFVRARARRDKQTRDREAFAAAAWEAAYRKAGKTDPAFDAGALDALRRWRQDEAATPDGRRATLAAFQAAAEKGCRNELFLAGYLNVVGADVHLLPPELNVPRGRGGLLRYVAGDAPAVVRLAAATRQVAAEPWEADKVAAAAASALAALMADPSAPPGLADDLAAAHVRTYALRANRPPWMATAAQAFADAYDKVGPGHAGYHAYRGDRFTRWAWDARGGGLASTVTPEGWRLFKERLAVARTELETAYRLDPADARGPTRMITVVMGQEAGREEMETWFRRAVAADPDARDAYSRKLYFLYPRWFGSYEEMLAFGRECLATENWRAGVPLVLVDAHLAISKEAPNPNAYLATPAVWEDLRLAYEGHLLNVPDDVARRSRFARYATLAGRWADADEQFKVLGDKADYAPFGGKGTYDYLRRKAARLAKAAPAGDPPVPQ